MLGTLIDQAIRHSFAPSRRAASYSSRGSACSEAEIRIMLKPMPCQVSRLPSER